MPFFITFNSVANSFDDIDSLPFVTSIIQDKSGYIWLGTQHGLIRYDSNNLITFSSSSQWSIPFNWANQLDLFNNEIVVSTGTQGIFLVNSLNGNAKKLSIPANIIEVKHGKFFANKIFFQNKDDLYTYDLVNNRTSILKENFKVFDIIKTKGNVYFLTQHGIYLFHNGKLKIINTTEVHAASVVGEYLAFSDEQYIYLINNNRIVTKKPLSTPLQQLTTFSDKSSLIAVDIKGKVVKFDAKSLEPLPHGFSHIGQQAVMTLLHDSSGVLWVNSNQGLTRHTESNIINHDVIFDISNNNNELLVVNDSLLVGTYGEGLQVLEDQPWFNVELNQSLTNRGKYIFSILQHQDLIIFGTLDGVWQYKLNDNKATRLAFSDNKDIVLKLYDDGENLYIGTNFKGIKVYNWQQKKIVKRINKQQGLHNLEVIDILPLPNNDIWLATTNSVEVYRAKSNTVEQVGSKVANKIISLAYAKNKIFAFSQGSGIFVFNRQGEVLSHLAQTKTFSKNKTINGEIWLAGIPGIYRLNPENHELSLVLGTEKYNFFSMPVLNNEKVVAWHIKGYVEIDHRQKPFFNPDIKISKTTISGKEYLNNHSITLKSNKEVITLDLVSLDYRSSSNKKFKYRINNNVWTPLSSDQITLTGLSSGDYTVEVMGTNSLGQWSNYIAYTNIHVVYPWYWKPQVRVIYVILIISMTFLSIWLIYLRAKSISSIYKALDNDIKTRGYQASKLARNINVALRLLKNDSDKDKAIRLLEEGADILTNSLDTQTPHQLQDQSLSTALECLVDYWFTKYHVKVSMTIQYDLDQLSIAVAQDIYKIIYTAIDNAILKSSSTNFFIDLKQFNHKLWLTIGDDDDYFKNFFSKVNFNVAMYTIRKIALKHQGSVNAYQNEHNNSQITLSFNLIEEYNENI